MEQCNLKSKATKNLRVDGVNEEKINKTDTSVSSKKSTRKTAIKKEVQVTGDEVEVKVVQNGKSKGKSSSENPKEIMRSLSFKGKVPVDIECFAREKYQVYYEGKNIYDAMLNQTNLKNNNNKFFLLQVLKAKTSYAVWFRWGRVGNTGQSNLINCGNDLEKAIEIFCKK